MECLNEAFAGDLAMIRITASHGLLAGLALVMAACATPASTPAIDWNRPVAVATVPVLRHDMAIANPAHPQPLYVDYLDEPTRFEFRPRHLIVEVPYNGTDQTEEVAADDGSYLENGVLYVDPSR
jgi:hypothetical protein